MAPLIVLSHDQNPLRQRLSMRDAASRRLSMIRTRRAALAQSVQRFSEKIMRKE